jgi:hypothetical protein
VYTIVHIIIIQYISSPKFLQVIFCYYSHLGRIANHSNVPIVYALQLLVQGHQGPLMFGVFMDEVDGV